MRYVAILLGLFLSFSTPTDVSKRTKPSTIRVLLADHVDNVFLEVKGRYHVYHPDTGFLLSSGSFGKRSLLSSTPHGLKWGDKYPSIDRIRVVPLDRQSVLLVNGIQYDGCVEIYSFGPKLQVINEVDVESYLKSTLALQLPKKYNREVMDCLAILARTNLHHFLAKHQNARFHVTAEDTGYQGAALTLQNMELDQAIERSRHAVLTHNNRTFATAWNEDSAGKTAPFSSIFRKEPGGPKGIRLEQTSDRAKWRFSLKKATLAEMIDMDKISEIDLFVDHIAERVYAIRFRDGDISRDFDFFQLQEAIGKERLKSNDFSLEVKEDSVTFTGFGQGHGVGLCIKTAQKMASNGKKAADLLNTFFPDTQLDRR